MIRVFQFFLLLFAIVAFYIALAFAFSYFPKPSVCQGDAHTIYLYHNDDIFSHTEIIMKVAPLKEDFFNAFPNLLRNNPNGYIAFSYGDRDFMMDEKGFDDINSTLALRGLFINTPALIKVGHYGSFAKERCQEIKISKECLRELKSTILDSFAKHNGANIRYHDRYNRYFIYYYKAKESYNLFHTCNTWTGDKLREAGLKMSYWTPLAENVISQLH